MTDLGVSANVHLKKTYWERETVLGWSSLFFGGGMTVVGLAGGVGARWVQCGVSLGDDLVVDPVHRGDSRF